MERTKKVEVVIPPKKPSWRKLGGGSLRIGNRIIKRGQVFEADVEEISPGFRRFVESLDGVTFPAEGREKAPPPIVSRVTYSIKHRSGGKYHVLDSTGKIVTEEALSKEEALALVESMQK
jgi:hypothetical protein